MNHDEENRQFFQEDYVLGYDKAICIPRFIRVTHWIYDSDLNNSRFCSII